MCALAEPLLSNAKTTISDPLRTKTEQAARQEEIRARESAAALPIQCLARQRQVRHNQNISRRRHIDWTFAHRTCAPISVSRALLVSTRAGRGVIKCKQSQLDMNASAQLLARFLHTLNSSRT